VPHAFQPGDHLWVNIGGPVYVSWNGSAWIRKTVASFDTQTWTATFEPGGDAPYELQSGREYYFNNNGTNYVVNRSAQDGAVSVQLEIQSVAHPWDAPAFLPAGAVLEQQWCNKPTPEAACSTFEFVSDPASDRFMKLVYRTVSDADAGSGKSAGAVVTAGMWGLQSGGVQYNWDYPQQGQDFGGAQQFLVDGSGEYVHLDDPIRLESVSLTNGSETRAFTLQFDGNWMQGLPNVHDELQRNGFEVNDAVRAKAFAVPTGTVIGAYVVKQLQVSEFMALSAEAPLDLTEAAAIDLGAVPVFVDHGMGAMPDPAPLKYSEGKPVTP
ncbi:MAG TPA: hypothetical protein PLL32_06820, partial [Anaeromyxobacteraceae bacterium]|nr:hypothetical protein [Anaeromyxobacteraceae bacterium]